MKKEYIAPAVEMLECETVGMTCASGATSDNGIGYGGIDDNGSMEAESRQLFNIFQFDD